MRVLMVLLWSAFMQGCTGDCCISPEDAITCDPFPTCCPGYFFDPHLGCLACTPGYFCSGSQKYECPPGTFFSGARAINASYCKAYNSSCQGGYYVLSVPSRSNNIVCGVCKTSCGLGEYLSGACSGSDSFDATACLPCRACNPGFYRSPVCDGSRRSDSECRHCTSGGCAEGTYRSPCQPEADGVCVPCTPCGTGRYNKGCTGDTDGFCTLCSTCSAGTVAYSACSATSDVVCKGGPCNSSTSCGPLFCSYNTKALSACTEVNFLCTTTETNGTCQPCPPGWTASGAFCTECAPGWSCNVQGRQSCKGECSVRKSPVCDVVTGKSVCQPCNYSDLLDRVVTRGGVLNAPELCDAYFQCKAGYFLTSNATLTGVQCSACSVPEPAQSGWKFISHGLSFGDKYSCLYTISRAPVASNVLGQHGMQNESCPDGYTSEPNFAPDSKACVPCANAPAFGGFKPLKLGCYVQCLDGYELRGDFCVNTQLLTCDGDGYTLINGACVSSGLPWSEPGNLSAGTGLLISPGTAFGDTLTWMDAHGGFYATATEIYETNSKAGVCSKISSVVDVGYVQDKPLFTNACSNMEFHTYYMVLRAWSGPYLYAFLERSFGANNRYLLWQIQATPGAAGSPVGKVWQSWRLPGKVCSAAWDAKYVFLVFCESPLIAYVRITDVTGSVLEAPFVVRDGSKYVISRWSGVLIGKDEEGKRDGMRDQAMFKNGLTITGTSQSGRVFVADRDNCRIVEVVIDVPGSFLTRATTIGEGLCYSGVNPTPFPRQITSALSGKFVIFMTDRGVMQIDFYTRTLQLIVPVQWYSWAPRWIGVDNLGSRIFLFNETDVAIVTRIQMACPEHQASSRGGACFECPIDTFASGALCLQCTLPSCSVGQRVVPCGTNENAKCANCTGTAPYPFIYGPQCSVVPVPPCPDGYYNVSARECFQCPKLSEAGAFDAVTPSGACQCFSHPLDDTGNCVVPSPYNIGHVPIPDWARGLNCTYEDIGCEDFGCFLEAAHPRTCRACPEGTVGLNGLWCEVCPMFREPNAARDYCKCKRPGLFDMYSQKCFCLPGYAPDANLGCVACPAGTYKANTSILPDSEYSIFQFTGCEVCPPGQQANMGSTGCVSCERGWFKDGTMLMCQECSGKSEYAKDATSGQSCVACKAKCGVGEEWKNCPVNDTLFACEPCATGLGPNKRWVVAEENRDCLWECSTGWFARDSFCYPCSDLICEYGFRRTECTKYEDAHCGMPCVNQSKPDENSVWGPGCTWECAEGFMDVAKVFFGWEEHYCESQEVSLWGSLW